MFFWLWVLLFWVVEGKDAALCVGGWISGAYADRLHVEVVSGDLVSDVPPGAVAAAHRQHDAVVTAMLCSAPVSGPSDSRSSGGKDKTKKPGRYNKVGMDPTKQFLLYVATVSDTLLWRDKKQTLTSVLVLVAIYYNFIVPGSTIITTLSKLLLLALVFWLIHSFLPEKIIVHKNDSISQISCFGNNYYDSDSQLEIVDELRRDDSSLEVWYPSPGVDPFKQDDLL
ncbi:hypothetical protein Q3G72_004224 [Acer saccharum]|nr:hypothetical protein Q3G72_004224 [Acer saccharum]